MKNLFLLLFPSLFLSCGNDDCIGDVVGTYNGTCTSINGTLEGVVNIFELAEGGGELAIEDGVSALSGYKGTLSANCKKIKIASQPVVNINGASFFVSGTLEVNGNTITGELTFDHGTAEEVCNYDLTK